METRVLPGIERQCGRVALGTLAFGAPVGPEEATTMAKTAIEAGVTMFDTANIYGDGASERVLGQALGTRRDECLIATKAHHRHGPGPADAGLSPAALRSALEGSLSRLGTDWVDLLYFHQPDWDVPFEESLGAAQELVEAGKAGGLLTERYDRAELPEVGRFASKVYRGRYWHDPVFQAVQQLELIARAAGLTLVELSYAWLWSRPLVDIVLLGASSLAQLEANLAAAAQPAPPDDVLAACDGVWERLRGPFPRYWR